MEGGDKGVGKRLQVSGKVGFCRTSTAHSRSLNVRSTPVGWGQGRGYKRWEEAGPERQAVSWCGDGIDTCWP